MENKGADMQLQKVVPTNQDVSIGQRNDKLNQVKHVKLVNRTIDEIMPAARAQTSKENSSQMFCFHSIKLDFRPPEMLGPDDTGSWDGRDWL